MTGSNPDSANPPRTKPSAARLDLAGTESSDWFDSWIVAPARSLVRDAEAAQGDYAASINEIESTFNGAVRAIHEQAQQCLLELDRQLSAIHDDQRVARTLLAQAGLKAPAMRLDPGDAIVAQAGTESDDLTHFVSASHNQLELLRTALRNRQRRLDDSGSFEHRGDSGMRWRWAARLGGAVLLLQAMIAIMTTAIDGLAIGAVLVGLALLVLGLARRPAESLPTSRPEPLPDLSQLVEQAEACYQQLVTRIEAEAGARRSREIQQLLAQKKDLSTQAKQRLAQIHPAVVRVRNDLEQLSPRWTSDEWQAWQPAQTAGRAIRIGDLAMPAPGIPPLPLLFALPGERALIINTTGERKQRAAEAVQSFTIRLLATMPPGGLHLSLVDALGLGQNAAGFMRLADFDNRLVFGKAATEAQQIERLLVELTGRMEHVIQNCLRRQYASIEDYNEAAGEIAEPYRLLTVFDFPVNFSETAARRLLSIIKSGPRCGVYTVLMINRAQALPRGFDVRDIASSAMLISWDGDRYRWQEPGFEQCPVHLDRPPEPELFQRIIDGVGAAAVAARMVEVPFSRVAPEPEQWWRTGTEHSISAPLGPSGSQSIQTLVLGSGTAQHALVAGKTGSGKSTLLHTLITSLALTYSPDELHLYLIDFKQGVEFKIYAEERLPHARVIAIESEREFGLSVLLGLGDELARRGERFRTLGVDNLAGYRAQVAEPLPRILLVVDEFQEFFTEDDQIAMQAAQLLDRLVRQGRAFGLHVLLGTQTLAGAYSLARGTIDQMTVRIALQCSDADSRLILADDNPAARHLSRPGEAIYNAANGLIEYNRRFQVAWLPGSEQRRYLTQIRQLAEARRDRPPEPPVVFEGNATVDISGNRQLSELLRQPRAERSTQFVTWLGEPVTVREPIAAIFRRQSGSNLLIIGQNSEAARALVSIALVSLNAQLAGTGSELPTLNLLDLGTSDAPDAALFDQVRDEAALPLRLGRHRRLPEIISEIAAEVQRRLDADLTDEQPVFLFVSGLHRARDLRPDSAFSFSSFDAEPVAPSLATQFETILREGPEVGIHTIAWCDTMTNLARNLDRRALREFGLRVAFQMSAEDSVNFIDTAAASKLGLYRAIFAEEDAGRIEKFRPYAKPSIEWFASTLS